MHIEWPPSADVLMHISTFNNNNNNYMLYNSYVIATIVYDDA